ncbi:hypothetical protein A6J63_025215, partial [Yersinia enterocolitica]
VPHWDPLLISCLTIAVARPQGVLTNQKGFLYPAQSWKLYGTPSLAGGFLCTTSPRKCAGFFLPAKRKSKHDKE